MAAAPPGQVCSSLACRLKPHQLEGVRFMWRNLVDGHLAHTPPRTGHSTQEAQDGKARRCNYGGVGARGGVLGGACRLMGVEGLA